MSYLLLSALFACQYGYPNVEIVKPPEPTQISWDKILANPRPIHVETINTGVGETKRKNVINLDHPNAANLPDDNIRLPMLVHILSHEEKGDFLIDAGLDDSLSKSKYGDVKGILRPFFVGHIEQKEGQDLGSQLADRNISPKAVYFTHLHLDHTAGLSDLPKDIIYTTGLQDTYHNYRVLLHADHLEEIETLQQFDFSDASEIAPLGKVIDVLGDGSLWAIDTRGHTVGHVSYFVNSLDGPVLLTGDASHTKWGFENGVEPGGTENREQAVQSLQKLIAFKQQYPQITVIYGHEMP